MKRKRPVENSLLSSKALGLAFDLGYTIAIPLVVFGLGGRWIDTHYHTHPVFFLVGLALALVATSIWLAKKLSSLVISLNK